MKTFIGILLIGLLGFSGCSSSDAESNPAYNVQAIGMVNGSELSVSAYVMDQEGNFRSDAMLTINDEPMNIGFFATEDMGMDTAEKGVQCGDYQPSYFLDLLDANKGDTVEFVAKGSQCVTLYTSSLVVPEKITIIEPSGDEPLPAGEPVVVRWEGGAPCSQFQVIYYRGSDAEMFSSEMIQGSTEFIMPAHWIDEGWGVIFVDGCFSVDKEDRKEKESGVEIGVEATLYNEVVDGIKRRGATNRLESDCRTRCLRVFEAWTKMYGFDLACEPKSTHLKEAWLECKMKQYKQIGCQRGCGYCP
jgi:hypothetical protein